jgi:RimJ/RimL family protein N-acetyltransferase
MVETISTERLVLRPLRAADAGPITLHASDQRVAWMTGVIPHPYPPGSAEAFIDGSLNGRRREDTWAIDATSTGGEEFIGVIGYRPEPSEMGYWVGPPYWNTGYATEAVRGVVAHLFTRDAPDHIVAHVNIDNPASAAVLVKAGFREAGRSEFFSVARNEEVIQTIFRLERAEWAKTP